MIDLSIVIVNFNTKELLKNCLRSVFKHTQNLSFEVIVVDNASGDNSLKILRQDFSRVKVIASEKNLGFAGGNNEGIKKAKGQFVLLLNSDTKIEKNAFLKLIELAKTKEALGICGPRLLNEDKTIQSSTMPFLRLPLAAVWLFTGDRFLKKSPVSARRVDWLSGACFLIKREVIDKVGLLDDKFFMYVEEMEYAYRAFKKGFQCWFFPQVAVYHLERGRSPEGKQKAIWWIYEGMIYFYRKHFAPWQLDVLKLLLRLKAVLAFGLGLVTKNSYLKKTYGKAFRLVG